MIGARQFNYTETQKTVNTRNISRMPIVWEKKTNQIYKMALTPITFVVSGLIGSRTINIPETILSVHGFQSFTLKYQKAVDTTQKHFHNWPSFSYLL